MKSTCHVSKRTGSAPTGSAETSRWTRFTLTFARTGWSKVTRYLVTGSKWRTWLSACCAAIPRQKTPFQTGHPAFSGSTAWPSSTIWPSQGPLSSFWVSSTFQCEWADSILTSLRQVKSIFWSVFNWTGDLLIGSSCHCKTGSPRSFWVLFKMVGPISWANTKRPISLQS